MKGNEFEYFLNNSIDFVNKSSLSTVLAKSSFVFLLLSMLFYWFQAIFNFKSNRRTLIGKIPSLTMWLANINLATLLFIRWVESGHFPLSNLYESLLFLSWSLTSIHFFLERAFNNRKFSDSPMNFLPLRGKQSFPFREPSMESPVSSISVSTVIGKANEKPFGLAEQPLVPPALTLGTITSPLALFINAFATFSLPQEMQKVTVLVPALHSNWLIMHVSVMMVSYAALLSGSLLAMAFLVVSFINDKVNALYLVQDCENERKKTVFQPQLRHYSQSEHIVDSPFRESVDSSLNGTVDSHWLSPKGTANETLEGTVNTFPKGTVNSAIKGTVDRSSADDFYNNSVDYAWVNGVENGTSLRSFPPKGTTKSMGLMAKPLDFVSAYQTFEKKLLSSLPVQDRIKSIDLAETLDNLSYRSIGLGFALLTIGIFSGAVWANEAWGSYWSWDPKETWAFVTWLVFAFYLHTRLSKGWVGKESAFVAIFGFLVVWFCYLGVNFFGKGLHSYGWFRPNSFP